MAMSMLFKSFSVEPIKCLLSFLTTQILNLEEEEMSNWFEASFETSVQHMGSF